MNQIHSDNRTEFKKQGRFLNENKLMHGNNLVSP